MPDTFTPNFNLVLPELGASKDTWGEKINANIGELDVLIKAIQDAVVPPGGIIKFSGAIADIPIQWALCDGTNGTPDLRYKFVRGAGVEADIGVTGGSDSVTLTEAQLPAHAHGMSSAGSHTHSVTVNEGGAHGHTGTASSAGHHGHTASSGGAGGHNHTGSTSGAGNHAHSGTTAAGGSHTHDWGYYPSYGSAGPVRLRYPLEIGSTQQAVTRSIQNISPNDSGLLPNGSHTHSFATNTTGNHAHSFTTSTVGDHSHSVSVGAGGAHTHSVSVGSGGAHTHSTSVSTASGHTHTVSETGEGAGHENRPAFYTLAYIMKL